MNSFTKEQYEMFFNNFEYTNAGIVYKPRTFCSQRLEALHQIILKNIQERNFEEKIQMDILSNTKLGQIVIDLMYEDWHVIFIKDDLPDFVDAIKIWRMSNENLS